jgi:hypothetical protein
MRTITAVAVAAVFTVTAHLAAQGPRMTPERLTQLAAKTTPHLPNGKPDLNGTWDFFGGIEFVRPQTLDGGSICVTGCPGQTFNPAAAPPAGGAPNPGARAFPTYKPELLAKVKDLSDRQVETDTLLRCQAPGVPRIGPPQKIMQNARDVVFLYNDVNGAFFRIIAVDGRPHRKDVPASYLGDAIGRWEGDTLVIETTNFNDDTWLTDNGAFHTTDLKVIERLRRVGDTLQYSAVAEDAKVLAEPWTLRPRTLWLTDQELEEPARCEDKDLEHIVDGSHHDNPR